MPHTYTNDIVTFYEDAGEGPVVVLIHGHSVDLRMWRQQTPGLLQAGYRVVCYDVRGHGRSMVAPGGYTWQSYAADLRDLLDRLNVERPPQADLSVGAVHLVGLSMGGGIALQFALDCPERVLSLTLVDSALPGFTYGEEISGRIQELVQAVRAEGVQAAFERLWLTHPMFDGVRRRPESFALLREMVSGFQAPEYREDVSTAGYEQPAIAERLGEIAAPALVVAGENDVQDFRLIAEILAANLKNARLAVMPGCHHLPPLEDPEAFNDLLLRFLRSASGRGV
ncbi:MAG: alpha/beta hydrolase [Dehalococcoidia bacterium]|nr:alpha/beta hydrolase [Dehalococcoidia bacterium]